MSACYPSERPLLTMLPAPISIDRSRRQFQKYGRRRWTDSFQFLFLRSRLSNVAVVALLAFALLSFILNLRYYLAAGSKPPLVTFPDTGAPWKNSPGPLNHSTHDGLHRPPSGGMNGPHGFEHHIQRIVRPEYARNLNHLIVVPGHAIWKGSRPELRMDDNEWVLEPYQKGKGRVRAFFSHIVRGYVSLSLFNYRIITNSSS